MHAPAMDRMDRARTARVLVIGGGVSGLSSAVRLLEAGFEVEVWTRAPLEQTTSSVAGAIWYPYRVGPRAAASNWALVGYRVFKDLALDPVTGVRLHRGVELFPQAPEEPLWRTGLDGFRRVSAAELPEGYQSGYESAVPVIEMPIYLPWLAGRVRALGGRITQRAASSLEEALALAPAVINCTGLAARELASDPSVHAIRGQLVRVSRGAVDSFLFDEHHPLGVSYVIPRSGDCILGGTAEQGVESLAVDPEQTEAILARCRALDPRLEGSQVLGVAVGLRPGRPSVRLELEPLRGPGGAQPLIHNYGHGGAGVTLSWGCAAEVVRLLQAWVTERAGLPAHRW